MSNYSIHLNTQELLRHMLQQGGTAACKLISPEQCIEATFTVELTEGSVSVKVLMGGHTGTLILPAGDQANVQRLREFIENIANGREDTAALAPASAASSLSRQLLTTDDERALRTVCRQGGNCTLTTGTIVTVHAEPAGTKRTAVAVHDGHTHLVSGSAQDAYLSIAERIGDLLDAA